MKRYSVPIAVEYNGVEEDPEGEWVRWDDSLVQAAPELLKALEDAERVLEWGEPEPKPILERVRRVIAKARGGQDEATRPLYSSP
jgi:hypothetical protein